MRSLCYPRFAMSFNQTGVLLSAACLALSACGYDNDSKDVLNPAVPEIALATIDTDATMENLDTGVGMYIEYQSGGTWRLQFGCDTASSNLDCRWSVRALTLDFSTIRSSDASGLDGDDRFSTSSDGQLGLDTVTTTEIDQVSFEVDPGTSMGFDIWLEGEAYPNRYVYWISDGGLNQGISSPSFNLSPSEP